MRLKPEQLDRHLRQGRLAPIYLLTGDEPLQLNEALDGLREHARSEGYRERVVMDVERGFDWSRLRQESGNLSLFAERRLLELRLGTAKPGREGAAALQDYAAGPAEDTLLLISAAKLDRAAQNSKWFKALEAAGVVIPIWPVAAADLPGWLERRARVLNLQLGSGVAELIAERVEGNLLAAAQELELLRLLRGEGGIDRDTVLAAVSDSARFDVFGLIDAALQGDSAHALRSLRGLRSEGVEAAVLAWALDREVRILHGLSRRLATGAGLGQIMRQARIWPKRQGPVGSALKQLTAGDWDCLLYAAGQVDRMLKGALDGDVWQCLTWMVLALASRRIRPLRLSLEPLRAA